MLVIRLSRRGRKKRPVYRIVLQEREWAPTSKAIENLGHMDPHTNPATTVLNTERIQYWMSQGAQPSTTVHNILVTAGVIKDEKRRSVFGKKELTEEEIQAAKEAEEAAKAPKEEPKEEAPVEEPAAEEVKEEAPAEEPKAEEKEEEKAAE